MAEPAGVVEVDADRHVAGEADRGHDQRRDLGRRSPVPIVSARPRPSTPAASACSATASTAAGGHRPGVGTPERGRQGHLDDRAVLVGHARRSRASSRERRGHVAGRRSPGCGRSDTDSTNCRWSMPGGQRPLRAARR